MKKEEDRTDSDILCANVKRFRLELGLTVEEFAEKTGISLGMMKNLDKGIVTPGFRISHLNKIDTFLGVEPEILFRPIPCEQEEQPPHCSQP